MSDIDVLSDLEIADIKLRLSTWERSGTFQPIHELLRRALRTIEDREEGRERMQKEIDELTCWIDDHNCDYQ